MPEMDQEESVEIEFEEEEVEDIPLEFSSSEERMIRTRASDPEITSLHDRHQRGKLVLQPDFQREFVWDRAKSSRLIESVFLSVPLPIIYLAEENDGRVSVIDGQQRLTAFFSYIDRQFPDGTEFKLGGMKVFPELNNKSFNELDETFQDKIKYYEIRAITILRDSDNDLKFEIFERLNTGAVPLNDMELRNCVYRGKYMHLLRQMALNPDFMDLMGIDKPDKRMKDVELVLRFASFFHATYLRYQSPMKLFFNKDMETYQNIRDRDAAELEKAFKNSVRIVKSLFGNSAFKRIYTGDSKDHNGIWEKKKFNASLYDIMMGIFHDKDTNQVYAALDSIREGLIDLMMTDEDFIDAILRGTSEKNKVRTRFDKARLRVEEILSAYRVQPRCFSRDLKDELYEANPTCAICGQRIQLIDDAAVDHIEQYWLGGQTIPENARLTHRYCNQARPRND